MIVEESIKVSKIDFGVSEGYRTQQRQYSLYIQKLTTIDGVRKKGKHNYSPSLAVDIYAYVLGKASYEVADLCYIAGVFQAVAERLYKEGRITHKLRWGGNWDGDGVIITDQRFIDLPHHELITV